jgi:hypothetical protein
LCSAPRGLCGCHCGGFGNNFWPSCHAANCALISSWAMASVLKGPSVSCRPLPHVTTTYQRPSALFRAYELGGEARSVCLSIQSATAAHVKNITQIAAAQSEKNHTIESKTNTSYRFIRPPVTN